MDRLFSSALFIAAVALTLPAAAQTPPTQGWPANRPPAAPAQTAPAPGKTPLPPPAAPGATKPGATGTAPGRAAPTPAPALTPPAPVPLLFFNDAITTEKKGEVTR